MLGQETTPEQTIRSQGNLTRVIDVASLEKSFPSYRCISSPARKRRGASSVKIDFVRRELEKVCIGSKGLAHFSGLPQIAECEEVQCFG